MYRKAVEDCQAGIRINNEFARIHKRHFKSLLALGRVQEAKSALDTSILLDPNAPTNVKDKDLINTVIHQLDMLQRFTNDESDKDYDRAVVYCSNILTNCPASVEHCALKCEYLLRSHQLKEASKFSNELGTNPDMANVPLIMCWRGRIVCYSGNETLGKQMLTNAIRADPDLTDAMRTIKMLKNSAT